MNSQEGNVETCPKCSRSIAVMKDGTKVCDCREYQSQEGKSAGIKLECYVCGEILKEPGALIFSPPDLKMMTMKHHICVKCWTTKSILNADQQTRELIDALEPFADFKFSKIPEQQVFFQMVLKAKKTLANHRKRQEINKNGNA